jgi:serine/threonine protein kinase
VREARRVQIHRDPSDQSRIKRLDFGLAKVAEVRLKRSSPDDPLTKTLTDRQEIVGTLQYMSPEQLEGGLHEIDTRADIFSFGLVVYEMLTGKPTDCRRRA